MTRRPWMGRTWGGYAIDEFGAPYGFEPGWDYDGDDRNEWDAYIEATADTDHDTLIAQGEITWAAHQEMTSHAGH